MKDEVLKIIAKRLKLDVSKIKLSDNLATDLKADSIDMVELITDFEDKYDIVINDEDAVKFKTVGDIVDYANKTIKK